MYLRSLINAFVVRCLDSLIPIHAKSKIQRPQLVSEVEQAGLSDLVANPEDRFSRDEAQLSVCLKGISSELYDAIIS